MAGKMDEMLQALREEKEGESLPREQDIPVDLDKVDE